MGQMKRAWCVIAFLGACGGDDASVPVDAPEDPALDAMLDPPPDLLEQSGSRLKVEWWETAEGGRERRGIYDSERDEECTFDLHWIDGELYCLPPLHTIAYADAACTVRRTLGSATVAPKYGAIEVSPVPACGIGTSAPSAIYVAGPATGETGYYVKQGGGCVFANFARVYAAYEAVPIEDFVHGVAKQQIGAGALVSMYVEADDGLVVPTRFFDQTHAHDCVSSVSSRTGVDHCAPTSYATLNRPFEDPIFTDASCTVPAIERFGVIDAEPQCEPRSTIALDFDGSTCGQFDLYDLGVRATAVYTLSGGVCSPGGSSGGQAYFDRGPLATLPVLTHTPDDSMDRIRTVYLTTPEGFHQHGGLYDADLGVECSIQHGDDGTPRCLPITRYVADLFTDDTCATTAGPVLDMRSVPEPWPCAEPVPTAPPYVSWVGTAGAVNVGSVDLTLATYYAYDPFTPACVEVEGYAVTPTSLDAFVAATAIVDP